MTTQTRKNTDPRPTIQPRAQRLANFRKLLLDAIADGALAGIGGRLRPERLAKTFEICAQREARLLDCSAESVLSAFVEAAAVGLEPNTPLEHASLTAEGGSNGRNPVADFQVTLRGLIVLAHRTGAVASVCARLVHAEEEFDVAYGTNEGIHHVPILGASHGPIIAAYAVVRLRESGLLFDVMSVEELEDIRHRWAKNPNSGAWETETGEMYKKTVLRRVMKLVPTESDEMARVVRQSEPSRPRPEPVSEPIAQPASESTQP